MPPVTRSCESTMLIDCPTAMSVSYSRLPATAPPCLLRVSPALFQNPSPFCENGSGPLRRANDITRQRMVLPRKRGGSIDNHPRVRVQLALIRRDSHVDAAAFGVLDDLHTTLGIGAGDNRPHHVSNAGHIHVIVHHHRQPIHVYAAAALRGDQARLLGV